MLYTVVQSPSHVQLFAIQWTAAHQASLSLTISQSLPKLMFIASVMASNCLIIWCPLLLLPLIFPSIRDFCNESSVCIKWPKYQTSASASVLPVNIQGWSPLRLTGLISLLSKGLSEVFSSTSIWRYQFFGALPSLWSSSHNCTWPLGRPWPWLYIPLSVMSLLFNTLSRFVIAFLPRSKHFLISWLQSPSAVILFIYLFF